MALFLADEHAHKIMLLGRWSSDAFLTYIRPQVQEWTSGMSTNMLKHDSFHLADPNIQNNKRHPSDPLLRNDQRSVLGSLSASFHGSNPQSLSFPKFHLFH